MQKIIMALFLMVLMWFALTWGGKTFNAVKTTSLTANISTLNTAAQQARDYGLSGVGIDGFSPNLALDLYQANGLLKKDAIADATKLAFCQGVWIAAVVPTNKIELYDMLSRKLVVHPAQLLSAEGFASASAAESSLGNLDEWARKNGVFSFNAMVYETCGGTVEKLNPSESAAVLNSAVTMPAFTLEAIMVVPQVLSDADLVAMSTLLDQAIDLKYGGLYPTALAQDCLAKLVVEASRRDSDIWRDMKVGRLNSSRLALDGAVLAKTKIGLPQLNSATSYEGADFRGIDIKGFDPSKKSLRNAIMPEDASSPRLFQWTTGICPTPETIWIDGKRPWG